MGRLICAIVTALFFMTCNTDRTINKELGADDQATPVVTINPNDQMAGFSLTVAEGKRLIAKGIANHPLVKQKMESGTIIITRGSTNTYIAEELIGLDVPHGQFVTGNITPANSHSEAFGGDKISEIVLVNGKQVEVSFRDVLPTLEGGDIIFKGGNLLNYEKKQAAVTVGATDGGTVGRIQPYTSEGPAHLIVPIGLEKEVYGDLNDYAHILSTNIKKKNFVPQVIVHKNVEIFTEIEAIKLFGHVNVIPYASGGLAGSEGGISFAVYGPPDEVEKILQLISGIQGEKAFVE